MSEKDKIREMVMALARGDRDAAKQASSEVLASKTSRVIERKFEEENIDEGDRTVRASHRHHNAARRDMETKRDMGREQRSRNDVDRDGAGREERDDASVRESDDTGSGSDVMKGKKDFFPFNTMDDEPEDWDDAEAGKDYEKEAKKRDKNKRYDHKDYTGDKPNMFDKKEARDSKPVNEKKDSNKKSSKKYDHKDYTGNKPSMFKKDDPRDKKPVTEKDKK